MAEDTLQLPKMTLTDWLDDLCVRFVTNLPQEELESVARICFQVEEAQWFYEDFIRPLDPSLPSLNLREFCLMIFQHCPLLAAFSDTQHLAAYSEFLAYKTRVPVRGAILLNHDMDECVLVKGWKKGANWSFPRGKINKNEKDLHCAVRELDEETGYDIRAAGLMPDEEHAKYIDVTMREQHIRLFVIRDVPMETHFEPKTRKEIGGIRWYRLADLPGFKKAKHIHAVDGINVNKFYMVAPFLGPLKKWVTQQKKLDVARAQAGSTSKAGPAGVMVEKAYETKPLTEPEAPAAVADPSSNLMRAFNGAGDAPQVQQPAASHNINQSNTLLAMLHGGPRPVPQQLAIGVNMPRTPLEQVDTFPPQEPDTTHPQHMGQTATSAYQTPPQPTLSPPSMQQHQQTVIEPLSRPQPFQSDESRPIFVQPGFPLGSIQPRPIPIVMQQQALGVMAHDIRFGQLNNTSMSGPMHVHVQPQFMSQATRSHQSQQHPDPAPVPQGPVAPKASQLPPPKLTSQSMDLLNSFKGGAQLAAKDTKSQSKPLAGAVKPSASYQAPLLDLFRKPTVSQKPLSSAPLPTPIAEAPVVEPRKQQERRPTINEITRTLAKEQWTPSTPQALEPQAVEVQPAAILAAPKLQIESPAVQPTAAASGRPPIHRQLFDPKNPIKPITTPTKHQDAKGTTPVTILARPQSRKGPVSPRPKPAASSMSHGKPENGAPVPSFTILARPGSSRGTKPPSLKAQERSAPPLSTASEKPFQPQLLKRPQPGDAAPASPLASHYKPTTGKDRRSNLLALFGSKNTSSSPVSSSPVQASNQLEGKLSQAGAPQVGANKDALSALFTKPDAPIKPTNALLPSSASGRISSQMDASKDVFLNLLSNKDNAMSASPISSAITRPLPERKSSQQAEHQNALLTLFGKPGAGGRTTSPTSPSFSSAPQAPPAPVPRSMAPSHASVARKESNKSPKTPSTPTETKGFLLDYLNGVVKKEHLDHKKSCAISASNLASEA